MFQLALTSQCDLNIQTGMPIAACAQKLKQEYENYPPDNPTDRPKFPVEETAEEENSIDEPKGNQGSNGAKEKPSDAQPPKRKVSFTSKLQQLSNE